MQDFNAISLAIFATFIATFGSYHLKKGALKFNTNILDQLHNYNLLIGVFFFSISTVFYLTALKSSSLSIIFPITSLSYVWVTLVSVKYLDENINIYKVSGVVSIISGVILVTQ